MFKNIGLAGAEFFYTDASSCTSPRGRVAAFTKSFHTNDIINNSYVRRLIKNAILWSNVSKIQSIGFLSTDNESFDEAFVDFLNDEGFQNVTLTNPWYKTQDLVSSFNFGCYILFPSYNGRLGNFMPDSVQKHLIDEVLKNRKGLIISEWFHYLQSLDIPSKRSFSFHGDGTIPAQGADVNEGLHTISPFVIEPFLNLSKPQSMNFIKHLKNDSLHTSIPNKFVVSNAVGINPLIYNTVGYDAISTDISELKTDTLPEDLSYSRYSKIFYFIDTGADVTTTTTTTTTVAPFDPNIKFKVATIEEQGSCGPYKLSLDGQHANLFSLEGGNLYLLKEPELADEYKLKLKYEDFFSPKRFSDVLKDISIVIRECNAPLSEPISGIRKVWGFREQNRWGRIEGSFIPDEYKFSGEGSEDSPLNVELGGGHNENIVMWIQVNQSGPLSYKVSSDTEAQYSNDGLNNPYCNSTNLTLRSNSDWANLYLVSGIDLQPRQHQNTISQLNYNDSSITLKNIIGDNAGIAGITSVQNSQPYNISFNPESNNNVYLLFTYSKDSTISIGDDKVRATLIIGTTEPPPLVPVEFTITYINRIDNSQISGGSNNSKTVVLKQIAGEIVVNGFDSDVNHTNDLNVSISLDSGYRLVGDPTYTIIPNDSVINIDPNPSNKLNATIRNFTMPANDGSVTIFIDAVTEPIPTTTPAPKQTYSLIFKNYANDIKFAFDSLLIPENSSSNTYVYNFVEKEGAGGTRNLSDCFAKFLTYTASEDGYTFYADKRLPIVSITDSSFNRTTITETSCASVDTETIGVGGVAYYSCKNGDSSFDINGSVAVSYGKSCINDNNPFPIRIDLPDMPIGGGSVYIRLDGVPSLETTAPPPPTTTTQPPVTTTEPCDNLILVLCSQDLVCEPDGSECSPNLSASSNSLVFDSCADLTEAQLIAIVYQTRISSNIDQLTTEQMLSELESYYSSSCPSTPTEAFVLCKPQSDNGSCVNTVGIETVDAMPSNPLP